MKYPWMPIFWGDLLAKTLNLSAAEFGAYVLLICHAWNHEAMVPTDQAQKIARVDNRNWKRIRMKVEGYFQCRALSAGRSVLYHERVALELALAAEKSNKNKDTALQMHANRRANAHANAHANALPSLPLPLEILSKRKSTQPREASYRPTGMSPDKGDQYRSPPRTKPETALQPLPDKPRIKQRGEKVSK